MESLYNRISVLIGRDVSVLSVSLPREGTGRRQSSPTQEAGSRQAPWSSSWTSGLQDCEIVRFYQVYKLPRVCDIVFGAPNHSVVSDALQPRGLQPTRLLCPWDSPGKNPGVGCHALLQGLLPTQVSCIAGRFFTV